MKGICFQIEFHLIKRNVVKIKYSAIILTEEKKNVSTWCHTFELRYHIGSSEDEECNKIFENEGK